MVAIRRRKFQTLLSVEMVGI